MACLDFEPGIAGLIELWWPLPVPFITDLVKIEIE